MMVVGLTGPYCDNNYGDYAMLVNNIRDIYDNCGNVKKIILFAYDKNFLCSVIEKYFYGCNMEIVEVVIVKDGNAGYSNTFVIDYVDEKLTPMEILKQIVNYDELRSKVSELDVLMLSGGGCFNYYWLSQHRRWKFYSMVAPMIFASQMKKYVVTQGNTFGPWGRYEDFFFMLLNYLNIKKYSVRDTLISEKALNKLGICEGISSNVDDLFFLDIDVSDYEDFIEEKYYVLELYCSMKDLENLKDAIDMFVKTMKMKYGLKTIFIPMAKEFGGERQGHYIIDEINSDIRYIEINDYLPIEKMENIIRNAEFILCDRYHAMVRSIANSKPCIQYLREIDGNRFYYYSKCVGLLQNSFGEREGRTLENKFLVTKLEDMFLTDKVIEMVKFQREFYKNNVCDLKEKKDRRIGYLKECCYGNIT